MKKLIFLCGALLLATSVFAQSDDDLFGGSDDDFFADDSIVEVDDVSAKTDLSKGVIFDSGTVKVGGSLTASIGTNTILYSPDSTDFGENLKNTTLKPELSALLSVDARPSQNLRMYTKFGFAYPFASSVSAYSKYGATPELQGFDSDLNPIIGTTVNTSFSDWFKLKELFTDFSIKETAFFRFGIHTVTWGTGYFFSPVSDMINTSSIDPENPEFQVDGALNLRTQIVFPDSQNCLWLYVIPSTDFAGQTAETYLRDTAFAAKADVLLGNCELGVGAFYKYQNAPKVMLTATGSLKKVSFFGEFVYSYGSSTEWTKNTDWDDKSNIFQATVGLNYYWKEPMISLAAQYYFNGNTKDLEGYVIGGHNIAAMVGFGKVFGTKDFSASLFAMANFGREEFTDEALAGMKMAGADDATIAAVSGTSLTTTAMLFYSPINELKVGMGPSLTFKSFDKNPTISLKLSATLGGGNF
ncbi:hypothetical protein SAMN04487977_10793 [Treponema bryantii]|uniref:DUF5723 domain-containing protein n=1 Tax=Treponema bryantii TaxID=163 RepID=A0A1H9HP86_9SPIR|nr:hypothetical protein [Treponema bryantii]SEQ64076.1 hypothetical protein SAMN04487977_10793 [Treponema bryantii]